MRTVIPPALVDAYNARQLTIYDISKRMHRSPSTVYHALKDEGVDTSAYRKRLEARNLEIVQAYRDLRNLEEVGRLFGIRKQRVHQIIEVHAPNLLPRKK